MPNNITNVITILADEQRTNEILELIKMKDVGLGSIDFEKIIPMPENIFRGDLGQKEKALYGKNNWYDWSIENWGTKWNSYGYRDFPEYEGGDMQFYTAWAQPEPVIKKLSEMFPDAQFRHAWADEDIGMNVGEILYQNGEYLEYDVPNGGSKEAYELAADILDVSLADCNLFYNEGECNYEYLDEDEDESEDFGGMKFN
jgi:hypothetical protein